MSVKDIKSDNGKTGSPQLRPNSNLTIKVKEANDDMRNVMGIFIKVVNLTIDLEAKMQTSRSDDIETDSAKSRSSGASALVSGNGSAGSDRIGASRSPGGEHLNDEYQTSDSKGGKSPRKSFVQRMTGKLRNSFRRHKNKDSSNTKAVVSDGPSSDGRALRANCEPGKVTGHSGSPQRQLLRPEKSNGSDLEEDGEDDEDTPAVKLVYADPGFDKIVDEAMAAKINPACGVIAIDLIRMANDLDRKYAGNRSSSVFWAMGTNYLRSYLGSTLDYTRFCDLANEVMKAVKKEEIGKQVVFLCKVVEEVILVSGQIGREVESVGEMAMEYFAENLAPRVAEEGGLAAVVRIAGENVVAAPV